jgi:hypothetical protein
MVAPARRISLAVSRRPWMYWAGVAALAVLTGISVQHITKPASSAAACRPAVARTTTALVGTHGLAVPLGDPALPLHAGDRVDIVGVATNMSVISVSETAAVVAVKDADVDAVVAAVRNHGTTLALVQLRPA